MTDLALALIGGALPTGAAGAVAACAWSENNNPAVPNRPSCSASRRFMVWPRLRLRPIWLVVVGWIMELGFIGSVLSIGGFG